MFSLEKNYCLIAKNECDQIKLVNLIIHNMLQFVYIYFLQYILLNRIQFFNFHLFSPKTFKPQFKC